MNMVHYVAFHLGLHSLPKFMLAGIPNENGFYIIKLLVRWLIVHAFLVVY